MKNNFISFFIISILLIGCNPSKYEKLITTEMSKEVRHDTIFLGFKFGKPKDHFYKQCKLLNEKKRIAQALDGKFVEYFFPHTTKEDKNLRVKFWGIFNDKKIMSGLKFEFTSVAWSPWNEAAQPKNLLKVVQLKLLEWFPGNDFVAITHKDGEEPFLVKVDGNRRITIAPPKDLKDIKVNIDDLRLVLEKSFE